MEPTKATLAFGGNGHFLDLNGPFGPMPDGVTVEFWARGHDLMPKYNSVFAAERAGGVRVLNIHLGWVDGGIYWDAGGIGPNGDNQYDRIVKQATSAEYKGSWVHWAFTKDVAKGEMSIYHNGALWHHEGGKTVPISDAVIARVADSPSGAHGWNGWLAEFRLWDRARTAAEIGAAMNKRLTGSEPGLVALWPLDRIEPDGVTRDLVGQHPAAVHGAPLSDHQPPAALPASPESSVPDPDPLRKTDMAKKKSAQNKAVEVSTAENPATEVHPVATESSFDNPSTPTPESPDGSIPAGHDQLDPSTGVADAMPAATNITKPRGIDMDEPELTTLVYKAFYALSYHAMKGMMDGAKAARGAGDDAASPPTRANENVTTEAAEGEVVVKAGRHN